MKKYRAAILIILIILLASCGEPAKTPDLKNRELRFPEDFTVEEIKLPKIDKQINSVAFSPDGSICVNLSRSIVIYDKQQTLIKTIDNPPGEFFHSVTFDEKGNIYAGGNSNPGDNFIRVYSADGELLKDYKNLLEPQNLAIIREIVIDKAGNMYVLIKYGSIQVLGPDGQLIKEITEGTAIPRSLFTDENGNICAGCRYADKPDTGEPRLYKFSGVNGMKYDCFDEYEDYIPAEAEYRSVIDKNGILYSSGRAYYDNFKKSCYIDLYNIGLYNSGFDFSNHGLTGWTKDNNGNAVFWLGLIQVSGGSGSMEYNGNLYRLKLKDK